MIGKLICKDIGMNLTQEMDTSLMDDWYHVFSISNRDLDVALFFQDMKILLVYQPVQDVNTWQYVLRENIIQKIVISQGKDITTEHTTSRFR